ncbi:unnamed protein product [Linum trigynum]|uniref:Uncharacterized protein n=1 Tax=Linum trigynum TaxID=586398 RepID=A0AAV2DY93_9ROSI
MCDKQNSQNLTQEGLTSSVIEHRGAAVDLLVTELGNEANGVGVIKHHLCHRGRTLSGAEVTLFLSTKLSATRSRSHNANRQKKRAEEQPSFFFWLQGFEIPSARRV